METGPANSALLQSPAGIQLIYTNIRGLRNKLEDLHLLLEMHSPDIIALSETWLNSDIRDSEIQLPGYLLTRADRPGARAGGGVLLYWKECLKVHILEVTHDEGGSTALWCRINDGFRCATLSVIYRSPTDPAVQVLDSICRLGKSKNCLVVGDFNAPSINWNLFHCNLNAESFDSRLLELSLECGLFQHVLTPTRIIPGQTCNILDLVLSSSQTDVSSLNIRAPLGKSDHCTLFLRWTRCAQIHCPSTPKLNVWRVDPERLRKAAADADWSIPQNLDVDDAWLRFHSQLSELIQLHVPLSRRHQTWKGPPWLDNQLRALMKKRRRLWDHFKKTRANCDYDKYKATRNMCSQ